SRAYSQSWDRAWNANSYRALNFGAGLVSLEQLTGNLGGSWVFSDGAGAAARAQLIEAVQNHDAVVVWSVPQADRPDDMPGGVISSHFYTVTGYNATTHEFTLLNPYDWGERTVQVTWSQLTRWFTGWSWVGI